jgi:hypothetical protein
MAFWELDLISNSFPERRQSMYQEVDRDGGSTWSQVYSLSLREITAIHSRIKTFLSPPSPSAPAPAAPSALPGAIAVQPKDGPVVASTPPPKSFRGLAAEKVDGFAKAQGSHPGAISPGQKLFQLGKETVLTNPHLQPEKIKQRIGGFVGTVLRSYPGWVFRQTFARKVTSVICGSPNSRSRIIINAADALAQLARFSINEDGPGQVQNDLPELLRTLASTIKDIENFVKTVQPHWTDVYFSEKERRVDEVEVVLDALKNALEEIVRAFGEYFGSMAVKPAEVKEWKKLVARQQTVPVVSAPSMEQVGQ